jgi:hypothetical protein
MTSLSATALFLFAAMVGTGCYSKATGYNGNFTFAYAAGAAFENFVNPIAPGAKLVVVAFANGSEDKLKITRATSSRPGVVAVESVDEHSVILKAGEPGVADIEVTAVNERGIATTDKTYFHVARPTVHDLQHGCTEKQEAIYVLGERIDIHHSLATSDGRPVIGYDYAPLRIDPGAALELIPQPQGRASYSFHATAASPLVSIHSAVDESALSLQIIERRDLNEATLECFDDCRILEGHSQDVLAHVRRGDVAVCSQTMLTTARSLTPEICEVSAKLDDGDDETDAGANSNREQLAIVKGLAYGRCTFEIVLPELNGGRGLRLHGQAMIGRVEFPDDRGSSAPLREPHQRTRAWYVAVLGWGGLILMAILALAARALARVSFKP